MLIVDHDGNVPLSAFVYRTIERHSVQSRKQWITAMIIYVTTINNNYNLIFRHFQSLFTLLVRTPFRSSLIQLQARD